MTITTHTDTVSIGAYIETCKGSWMVEDAPDDLTAYDVETQVVYDTGYGWADIYDDDGRVINGKLPTSGIYIASRRVRS